MSISSPDKLLSQLTGGASDCNHTKNVDNSPHGNPREHFHMQRKFLGCTTEIEKQGININDCISARQYCEGVMNRYITLLDAATFMPSEHIQKEKEYGITWRTAFKKELSELVGVVTRKLISAEEDPTVDPFETLHKIVKKDCIDGATFDSRTQADLICMLISNLDMLETCIFQVKALLKEPNHDNFDSVKNQVLEKLKSD
jgi:hypothetical protein